MGDVTEIPGGGVVETLEEAAEAVFVEQCDCGCISFVLLRGDAESQGEVKCISCGDVQVYLRWFDPDPGTREGA